MLLAILLLFRHRLHSSHHNTGSPPCQSRLVLTPQVFGRQPVETPASNSRYLEPGVGTKMRKIGELDCIGLRLCAKMAKTSATSKQVNRKTEEWQA